MIKQTTFDDSEYKKWTNCPGCKKKVFCEAIEGENQEKICCLCFGYNYTEVPYSEYDKYVGLCDTCLAVWKIEMKKRRKNKNE